MFLCTLMQCNSKMLNVTKSNVCVNASRCMKHSPLCLLSLLGKEFDYFIEFCCVWRNYWGMFSWEDEVCTEVCEFIFVSSGKKGCSPHGATAKVISSSQEHLACLLADSLFGGTRLSREVVIREEEEISQVGGSKSCSALWISGWWPWTRLCSAGSPHGKPDCWGEVFAVTCLADQMNC